MKPRQTLCLAALGFAIAAIVGLSATAKTDLTGAADAALFGDHLSAAAAEPAEAGPEPRVIGAWPCIDAPGCDRPSLEGFAATDGMPKPPPQAMTATSAVPLPTALTLLGLALSGAALGVRSRRRVA